MFGTNVWILVFFLKRLILGSFLGHSVVCFTLFMSVFWKSAGFLKWCNPWGHCASIIIFLGTLREINLNSNSCRLQRKWVQTKNLGACEETGWGFFIYLFFFVLPKVWGYINGKYCHCQETPCKCSLSCNCSWQDLPDGAGLPGMQTPSRQDFHSQCFCQSSWTSELLLFNYRWILATLRQWAFTIAREVIAFTF